MSLLCFTPRCGHEASSVLSDVDGIRRAVCGDCAGEAVSSRRWVAVVPIEAVGEKAMAAERASGREARLATSG